MTFGGPSTSSLTWLGGAGPEIDDPHERSGYAVGGAAVLLFAAVAGLAVALAGHAAHWPLAVVAVLAVLAALLVGSIARALATASLSGRMQSSARRRGDLFGRMAIAALAGVLIAELASTVLLGGTVDRSLDERARREAESAPTVVTARGRLDQARADRAALDRTISKAQGDIDQALVVARCEYNPTDQCPRTRITGVPGRGPESRTANAMLEDARGRLAAAQNQIPPLDARITDREQDLDQARTAAFHTGDRGLGARWLAMHDYTLGHGGALLLRSSIIVLGVLLALLPLLLRWWRGETSFDRRRAARTVTERAEQAAAEAIAVQRAQVRVETEKLRADQELASARLAAHAETAIDRERQRKRIIAAIGNLEIGVTEPQRRAVAEFEALAQLPAGAPAADRKDSPVSQEGNTPNLPAQLAPSALAPTGPAGAVVPAQPAAPPAKKSGGLELPVIGTVPFTDTAARWIRPLVPSFVANAIDTATSPLRTVRQAFEEAEEITFTLRRTRKVTVNSEDSAQPYAPAGYQLRPDQPGYPQQVAAQVVDAQYPQAYHDPRYSALPSSQGGHGLPGTDRRDALPGRAGGGELEHRGPRELPPGSRPE
ncbi:DUF4407 domain-containing protein [Nocardia sp. CDC159]|uniref:DUF4407 domain-containing protein n=1 Tax=Nocardia pulmonis TaxID=2951408 RepID=A0A9X2EA41_9NOCA|nr:MULTISPECIES: DUF4407 domain-containing protein [Nocardia]MCM6776927.1 DUF4407 domain-containing protein [Nocardia pulmonis]MCM6789351.1 DUF4407 domain-containing protein [Nocardia sp. CDC159]